MSQGPRLSAPGGADPTEQRAAYHAPRLIARLTSPLPAKLHPRNGEMLDDKRVKMELALRRSVIVARQFAIDEHDKVLNRK